VPLRTIGLAPPRAARDLWTARAVPVASDHLSMPVDAHGTVVLRLSL
jgi:hypothetical protein